MCVLSKPKIFSCYLMFYFKFFLYFAPPSLYFGSCAQKAWERRNERKDTKLREMGEKCQSCRQEIE